jgi:glycosyltransferase involved in cell wall biosynthesis
MKLAILTSRFPLKDIGGAELAAHYIGKYASIENEVFILTRRQLKPLRDGYRVRMVRYIGVPAIMRYISTVVTLTIETVRIKPQAIFAEMLYSAGMAAVLSGKLLRVPVFIHPGGEIYWTSKWNFFVRYVLTNATLVLALTEHMKKEILRFAPHANVEVLPNGVDLKTIEIIEGATVKHPCILYAGRMEKIKGVEYLIGAFSAVKEKIPTAHLYIIGSGLLERNLKKLADRQGIANVHFLGMLENRLVLSYMKSCDVFVLPSLTEGFPLVLVEAMACGAPIVATNVKGINEIIEDGKNGFLVGAKDEDALASKIITILTDSNLKKDISKNNVEKSREYDWKTITKKLMEKFSEYATK